MARSPRERGYGEVGACNGPIRSRTSFSVGQGQASKGAARPGPPSASRLSASMHVNSGTPHVAVAVAVEADGDAWSSERGHSIHTKLIPSRVRYITEGINIKLAGVDMVGICMV